MNEHQPKTSKAIAVIDTNLGIIDALNIFRFCDKDTIALNKDERICEVEITFKKWIK